MFKTVILIVPLEISCKPWEAILNLMEEKGGIQGFRQPLCLTCSGFRQQLKHSCYTACLYAVDKTPHSRELD